MLAALPFHCAQSLVVWHTGAFLLGAVTFHSAAGCSLRKRHEASSLPAPVELAQHLQCGRPATHMEECCLTPTPDLQL